VSDHPSDPAAPSEVPQSQEHAIGQPASVIPEAEAPEHSPAVRESTPNQAGFEAPAAGVDEAPVAPIPSAPAPRGGTGHVIGAVVAIAIIGVVLSAAVGGVAGYLGSRYSSGSITAQSARTATEPVEAAAAVALPAVVNIDVTESSSASGLPQGHPDVPSDGTGSGVAFKSTADGGTYIITNNHVVAGATKIVVTPADSDPITATLVGTDPQTDIAVIKVATKIQTITVGDSEGLVVGETAVAIGSPYGLQHSVSSGVISAVHRSLTASYSSDSTGSAYPLVDVIQTDAAINPGNSGGALVDLQGRLVGINSAIYTESGSSAGIGFSIPSRTAIRIADELISTGKATHPFLGVEGRTVTASVAKEAGLSKAEGAAIAIVIPETGAAKAGLRKGDIITRLDDTQIRTMDDLILAVRRSEIGETVTLTVWRDHAQITLKMTIGDKPSSVS
jgi:S1-C subfamily serine protease